MEHTIAYMRSDVEREARRADYLHAALRNYAPHTINDIDRQLADEYPRARCLAITDEEIREGLLQ